MTTTENVALIAVIAATCIGIGMSLRGLIDRFAAKEAPHDPYDVKVDMEDLEKRIRGHL